MTDKIVDIDSKRAAHTEKRKQAKVESLREAFRAARGEPDPNSRASRRRKKRKK
ncbi:MAG: hypothetical protein RKH07_02225 [Gammaproteobacteria bacterium]